MSTIRPFAVRRREKIGVRITTPMFLRLSEIAAQRKTTKQNVFFEAIEQYLARLEKTA